MDVSLAATEPDLVGFRNKERGTALYESWLQGRMISSLGTPPPPRQDSLGKDSLDDM